MRIISKFHDYYDPVQAYGMDKTCIYKRKTKEFDSKTKEFKEIEDLIKPGDKLLRGRITWGINRLPEEYRTMNYYVVFFCGTVVPVIECGKGSKNPPYNHKYFYYYNIDELEQGVFKYGTKQDKKHWGRATKYFWSMGNTLRKNVMTKYFNLNINSDTVMNLHHKYGTPIILYDEDYQLIKLNPKLKNIKFYKHKDVYTCFQDINQFISGILGGQSPPLIEISDSDRIAMRGFNKWSFRKPPKKE
jgi:hypothetical protein